MEPLVKIITFIAIYGVLAFLTYYAKYSKPATEMQQFSCLFVAGIVTMFLYY